MPATAQQAALQNISTDGCMISTRRVLHPGATILLGLSAEREVVGRVIWTESGSAGIKFDRRVHSSVVEAFQRHDAEVISISLPFEGH